jgi:hypothetical protein
MIYPDLEYRERKHIETNPRSARAHHTAAIH